MAKYPVKVMLDHNHRPFFPFITPDVIVVNDSDESMMDLFNDRYTKEEVDAIIASLGTLQRICGTVNSVSDLPETAENGDTYIVLTGTGNNNEFMWINNGWEELGPLVDLTGYYTKQEVDNAIAGATATIVLNYEAADATILQNAKDYTDLQISNLPATPTALSQLTDDATHRTVTDTEKTTWNNKSNFSGNYNDLTNKPVTADLLHYKGHVADVSQLPSVGQSSGTADPRGVLNFNLNNNYMRGFTATYATDSYYKNSFNTIINNNSSVLSGYNYYIITMRSGTSNQYQIIAFNHPEDIKIQQFFVDRGSYNYHYFPYIIQVNASASHPVRHFYKSNAEGAGAWRRPCKRYFNNGANTSTYNIDTTYTEPVIIASFNDNIDNDSKFYTNCNIKYTSDVNNILTNVSMANVQSAFGSYYNNPGYSINITSHNNYIYNNGMIFNKAYSSTDGTLNLQFDETTTQLNDTYTVGSNYDIYRRNESVNWDIWSKSPAVVTTISSTSTDDTVPSARAVYDYIDNLNGNGSAY